MSAELYAKLAKYHAAISDIYEELGNSVEEEPATKPAKGKGKAAAAEAEDDDLPEPKKAGTAGKTPAKKTTKAKPAVEEEEEGEGEGEDDAPTEEDVVAAAQALIQANDGSKDKALAIIKKHGGKRVADLDEDVYADVIAAFKAAMPKKGKKVADPDDDI